MRWHDTHHLRPLDSFGHSSLTPHRQPCLGPCLHPAHFGDIGAEQSRIHTFLDRVNVELAKYVGEECFFRWWSEVPFFGIEPSLFDTLFAGKGVWHERLGYVCVSEGY